MAAVINPCALSCHPERSEGSGPGMGRSIRCDGDVLLASQMVHAVHHDNKGRAA